MPEEQWGSIVSETIVPAGHGRAFEARAGDFVAITDLEGQQIGDLVVFNARDPREMLDTARTRSGLTPARVEVAPGQFQDFWRTSVYLSVGDEVSTNMRNPILKLVEDTVGVHDLLFAPCDLRLYQDVYGYQGYHRNCLDNLTEALAPYGIRSYQIPAPINVFQNTPLNAEGRLEVRQPLSRAGDSVVFEALMDVIGALSSCPMDLSPANGGRVTPLKVVVRRRT